MKVVSRIPVPGCLLLAFGLFLSDLPRMEGQAPTGKPPEKSGDATGPATLPGEWVKSLAWRAIGPANMGGRITAISVCESDPTTWWVATASGGLLKTVNNGITFEHQFDREATVSLGDVCVAPSNPSIVWVGTGENNPRNSVSYGDGVYNSIDGGKTWKNMGLRQSFQIGKILVHPKNPDIVWVGALGRLYGPNPERGLYKTVDGGKTWDRVLFIDDRTGIIDIRMHPRDPETLLVASWDRQRDGFDSYIGEKIPDGYDSYDPIRKWGPGAGIWKTTDGGKTFRKLTRGLPTCPLGRIGLDYYLKDPNIVFAIVDCEKIGMGTPPKTVAGGTPYMGIQGEDAEGGARLVSVTPTGPAGKAGLQAGDVIQGIGTKAIKSYNDLIDEIRDRKVGDKVKVKALRDQQPREFELILEARPQKPGGAPSGPPKTRPYLAQLAGQPENVQDRQGPDSFQYGGVYKSIDGGESWTRVNSVNPRPMYFGQVRVDPSDDKYVYVLGVVLYRSSDGGKTFRGDVRGIHADQHALWIDPKDGRHMIVGTDGGFYVTHDRMANWDHLNHLALGQFYHVAVCSKRPYFAYGGLQDNGTWGGPSLGQRGVGPINEDWIAINGGDGFVCRIDPTDPDLVYFESQNGFMGRRNLRTGERAMIRPARPPNTPAPRFNWNTPFILSHHNPRIFYCAGSHVYRSINRGDDLRIISPEITPTKRGSGTALAESPRNPDVLWAGTDDGGLWVTRTGGKEWTNVASKVGLPDPRWVATIEPSRFVEGRCYVAFDAHRSDDDEPYLYVTEDFGQTWKSIRANLPSGSTRCLREDVVNRNLLYAGTEFAIFASLDRGLSWTKLNANLPTVAIHEIAVHPTAGEIVAATHGRSLWVLDVSALRQVTPEALTQKPKMLKPNAAVRWQLQPSRGRTNRRFAGQNPPSGAQLWYSLPHKAEKVSLRILDIEGTVMAQLPGPTSPGLHRVSWDLMRGPVRPLLEKPMRPAPDAQARRAVAPGAYRVVLTVDGQEQAQTFLVEADPNAPGAILVEEDDVMPARERIDD